MVLTASARLAALLGDPVAHSLSPALHNFWFKRYGIDGVYIALRVPADDLATTLRLLPRLGFRGFNVTLPHKEAAFRLVDRPDAAAARIAAVNTILVQPDGTLLGCNTDGEGFLAHLRAECPSWRPGAAPVVLLGAGGAARAVAAALIDAGVQQLRLVNRSRERAEALAAWLAGHFAIRPEVVDWQERAQALAGAGLLVNCTSLGMSGKPALDLPLDALPLEAIVADIVYVPLVTDLLRRARQRGHRVVDGLGMLIRQAVPGFRHWGGIEPQLDQQVRDLLLQGLASRD
ncbi:MAG: shikimate dehydrogenase (NADP(+)) [Nitrospiraceae bacterium]|jgi:shikimate dehydrogenase|nr:MAG: shikimate dehydrogenase (NADP(+)) [Nitrospiraceae bacterium]